MPRIDPDPPIRCGIQHRTARRLGLDKESGSNAHLRHRSVGSPVPYRRRDMIMARMQVGTEIEPFIAPMGGIAPGGSRPNAHAVDVEDKAIVRADMNHQVRRRRAEVEIAPEMEHDRTVRRRRGIRDPGRRRASVDGGGRMLCRPDPEYGGRRRDRRDDQSTQPAAGEAVLGVGHAKLRSLAMIHRRPGVWRSCAFQNEVTLRIARTPSGVSGPIG